MWRKCSASRLARGIVLLAGTVGLNLTPDPQEGRPLVAAVERGKTVVQYDTATGARALVYTSQNFVGGVQVSRLGPYLAFLEKTGLDFYAPYRVVVIGARGDLIALVEKNVQRFIFCCGHDKLALILGQTREGGFGFTPEAVLVVDIRTGEETPLDLPAPYELFWASFDSSLYIGSRPPEGPLVYRYEPISGRLSVTSHRGVQFSPDGRYYLDDPSEDRFRLYRSDDDRDVTTNLPPRFRGFWSTGWVPGAGHILVFSEADAPSPPREPAPPAGRRRDVVIPGTPDRRRLWNYFVDAETGQVIDTFRGAWLRAWSTNANAVPVSAPEGIRLVRPQVK